jgi:single-strand DNA-binding protein
MYAKTQIIGHIGGEVEMRYTPQGIPVTNFSVATNRTWKDANGEKHEKVTWFRVTVWRQMAETCAQYLSKGRLVFVEGEIEASAWTDKEGNAKASLELTATTVKFLSGRNGEESSTPASRMSQPGGNFPVDEDNLPF